MGDRLARDVVVKPRLRRLATEWKPGAGGPGPSTRDGVMLALGASLAAGLFTGQLELGLTLALEPLHDPAPGLFRGNRHILWIIPVVNLAVFSLAGLVLGLAARSRRATPARGLPVVLAFLGSLTLLLTIRGLHAAAAALLAAGFAWRLGPRLAALIARRRRAAIVLTAALAVNTAGVAGLSAGREILAEWAGLAALPAPAAGAPNVLLLVLDTVRADHLSLYGYDRDTTPCLARLAREGVRFDQARSPAPWTLPSHASMFTGRWPHELSAGMQGPLDETYPTLAEALRNRGYVTGGFVANTTYCSAESGLARGFLHYEDHALTPRSLLRASALGGRVLDRAWACVPRVLSAVGLSGSPGGGKPFKDAATLNADFLDWLDDLPERPFFAFLNFFDAHHPYLLPAGEEHHFGLYPQSRDDVLTLHRWWSLDKRRLPERDRALARDAYDDCLAYLDAQLGRLFAELDRRGVLEETLVIVTADHGEHFGEHQIFGHASSLYQPEVHVPLVLAGPGVPRAESVGVPVSLRDLPATVVDLLGAPRGPSFPGHSLARFWSVATPPVDEPVLSEVDAAAKSPANGGRSPVFRGPMKAILAGQTVYVRNGDGREELYDLAADPGETHDLAALPETAATLDRMREALARILRGEP
jgi:arylsulfatase A-like enzyme